MLANPFDDPPVTTRRAPPPPPMSMVPMGGPPHPPHPAHAHLISPLTSPQFPPQGLGPPHHSPYPYGLPYPGAVAPTITATNAPPIHPCGRCKAEIREEEEAIQCSFKTCCYFYHRTCCGLSKDAYQALVQGPFLEWICDSCADDPSKNIAFVYKA